ncbi:MAG TPA: FbpB family small basic protein [Virgibacillus sp.]|nr:FbpB family small basic protein [Virgibacillus sp.]
MRSKYHRFEDLVSENKRELMDDEQLMQRLEMRLEDKQSDEDPKEQTRSRRIFQR